MNRPFIDISQLTKCFRAVVALDGVSLALNQGEGVGIMGANGAGKSTLLKILAGLITPSSGTVRIDGVDVPKTSGVFKRRIGFAAGERPGFYDRLTVRQNLEFFSALHGLHGAGARRRIAELLDATAMPALDQPYQELSTGMKQRLLLARTLLHDPQVLLLDEPTRSLDPVEVERFYGLIKRLQSAGKTILFTTHQRQDAEAIASRLIVLNSGRIQSEADIPEMAIA